MGVVCPSIRYVRTNHKRGLAVSIYHQGTLVLRLEGTIIDNNYCTSIHNIICTYHTRSSLSNVSPASRCPLSTSEEAPAVDVGEVKMVEEGISSWA